MIFFPELDSLAAFANDNFMLLGKYFFVSRCTYEHFFSFNVLYGKETWTPSLLFHLKAIFLMDFGLHLPG